jgi:hypothetical protein
VKPVVVQLVRFKETKHTFRFDAEWSDGPVANVYVRKEAFPDGEAPDFIRLTIEDASSRTNENADALWKAARKRAAQGIPRIG